MSRYAFLLIFFLLTINLFAQIYDGGVPLIKNFSPKEYNAHLQNWSIIQDSRGIMYFGNHFGILEYDGINWQTIPCSNNSTIRSLAIDKKGTVYAGAIGDFGYLACDAMGKYSFVSLVNKLPESENKFNDIWKTYCVNDEVYFISLKKIYLYKNEKITIIPVDLIAMQGFIVNNHVFVLQRKGGIYAIKNSNLFLLPHTEIFNSDAGRTLFYQTNSNKLIICSANKGVYSYNLNLLPSDFSVYQKVNIKPEILSKISTDIDKYVKKNGVYCRTVINDSLFALGTVSGGIVIFNEHGHIKQIINKNRGLPTNTILNLYLDNHSNLWAALPQGISLIEINSPLSLYNESTGLAGSLNSTCKLNGRRYAISLQGLYYLPFYKLNIDNDEHRFQQIIKQNYFCWDMIIHKNKVFATGTEDIVRIDDTIAVNMNIPSSMYCFGETKKFADHIFLGLQDGVAILETSNESTGKIAFTKQTKVKEINEPIRKITEDSKGDLWLTTNYNGILHMKFKKSVYDYRLMRYDTSSGLPKLGNQYVFYLNNKIYACTNSGIYIAKLSSDNDSVMKFVPDSTFGYEYANQKNGISQLYIDKFGKVIINSDKAGIEILQKSDDGKFFKLNTYLKKITSLYKKFQVEDDILWISTSDGLFRYDSKLDKGINQNYQALIRLIKVANDSVIFNGNFYNEQTVREDKYIGITSSQPQKLIYSLDAKHNSLSIYFSTAYYTNSSEIRYKYILENFEKSWSNWTKENKKEYTNLPEGSYTFRVKAINIFGIESSEAVFRFNVLAPWYKTIYAYICYLILFLTVFYVAIKLNSKRLQAANIRLEKIVQERTIEIMQQKEEIKSQAEQLEITNKELEKLSIVASETDNVVAIFDKNGDLEWVNKGFSRIYGYSIEQFTKERGKNIFESSTNLNIKQLFDKCKNKKVSINYESNNITKSGKKIWVQTTFTPILDLNKDIQKYVAIESDISRLKDAEYEIIQRNEEILAQRDEIEKKNTELEIKNHKITGSIRYAKTIQQAILPAENNINKYFDNFILYRPKDIVSGDFYWMWVLNQQQNIISDNFNNQYSSFDITSERGITKEKIFFALADCTGHGVPGAFMSMIGSRLLSEIIVERNIHEPAEILELLDTEIRDALKQKESDNTDGMDLILCRFEKTEHEFMVTYSGSKSSFVLMRKNHPKPEIMRSDRKTIGGIVSRAKKYFSNRQLFIQSEDLIYLLTDGIIDQNNFERQKFSFIKFVEIVQTVNLLPMNEQKLIFEKQLDEWMQNSEQRDDISVIGLKMI